MKTQYYLLENEDGLQMAVLSCTDKSQLAGKICKALLNAGYAENNIALDDIKEEEDYKLSVSANIDGNYDETFGLIPIDLY